MVINVDGKQSHGSKLWASIDPIVTSLQIINGIQTIISQQTELTNEGAVITVRVLTQEYVIISFLKVLKWSGPFAPWIQKCKTKFIMIWSAKKIEESMGAKVTTDIEREVRITFTILHSPTASAGSSGTLGPSMSYYILPLRKLSISLYSEKRYPFF